MSVRRSRLWLVLILALDTSTEAVVAAVLRTSDAPVAGSAAESSQDEVLGRAGYAGPTSHGEQVGVVVERALAASRVTAEQLDVIGVGRGPGPFTGLRVGLAHAEVLGWVLGIPVHGVCSLDVLAAEAHADGIGELLAVTDARRREVYWARYGADGARLAGPAVSRPLDVADRFLPVVGSGAQHYPDAFPQARPPAAPDAGVLARLVAGRVRAGAAPEVGPLYLRRPDAVAAARRKRVT